MAIIIELKNFPISKTIFQLLKDQIGRKQRVKDYIDEVGKQYPSLQPKIDDVWKNSQAGYDKLSDNSDHGTWITFFTNKFNGRKDLVVDVNKEALKEFDTIFAINSTDDDLLKLLKTIALEQKEDMNPYFDDLDGGVSWILFLTETFKQFYLVELPKQINNELTKGGKTFAQLQGGVDDLFKLKKCFDKSFKILYTSFSKTEDEPDLNDLVDDTNKNLQSILTIIGNVGVVSLGGDIAKLTDINTKLKNFAKWQTKYIKTLVEMLYAYQQNTPQPIITPQPNNNQQQQPINPITPTPTPIVKPDEQKPDPVKPPTPTPIKDPWLDTGLSGTILNNAKSNYQPTDIAGGKYQNISLTVGDATEKQNILGWRQAFANFNNNPPYQEFNLGDIDNQGKYKGVVIGAKTKSQIESELNWDGFFTKHTDITDKDNWKAFTNPIEAETIYNNGWTTLTKDITNLNQGSKSFSLTQEGYTVDGVEPIKFKRGEGIAYFFQQVAVIKDSSVSATYNNIKSMFTDTNIQSMINKFPIPSSITVETLKTLRDKRLIELFKKEFESNNPTNTQIDPWLNNIDQTGLDPTQSRTAYDNGWQDPHLINNGKQTYQDVEVEVIKHIRDELDKAFVLINQIKGATVISDLPTDTKNYDESKVPTIINFASIKKLRDDKEVAILTKEAFAKFVELVNGITATTDISKLPTDQEIKDKYNDALLADNQKYANVIVSRNNKRTELLKAIELSKYNAILAGINDPQKNSFKSLPEDFKKADIEALDNKLLPTDKQKESLTQTIKDKRATFFYSLTDIDPQGDMEGKGISPEALALAQEATKNVWDIQEYDKLTPEILNNALNACKGLEGKLIPGGEGDGDNLDQFLKDKGGYEIDTIQHGVEAKEKVLPKETKGTYLLPLFYKMNNYDYTAPEFCQWAKVKKLNDAGKEVDITVLIDTTTKDDVENPDNPKKFTDASLKQLKEIFDKGIKGQWAIGTGVGKTTKSMNCLLYMLKELYPNG